MAVFGMTSVEDLDSDEIDPQTRKGFSREFSDLTPFTAMSLRLKDGMESSKTQKFMAYEQTLPELKMTENGGGATDSATTLTVDDNSLVKKWQIIYNQTDGEYMQVDADPSPDSNNDISVVRESNMGGSSSSVSSGADLYILSVARPHGDEAGKSVSQKLNKVFNYIQEGTQTYSVTLESEREAKHTGSLVDREKEEARRQLMLFWEHNLFRGFRHRRVPSNEPIHTTKGLLRMITTNVWSSVGNLTYDNLLTYIYTMAEENPDVNEIMAWCGMDFSRYLETVVSEHSSFSLNLSPGGETYGISLKTIETSVVNVRFKVHPLFSRWGMSGDCVFDNPRHRKLRYPKSVRGKSFNLKHEPIEQTNNKRAIEGEFSASWGLELTHEQKFGYVQGVTGTA